MSTFKLLEHRPYCARPEENRTSQLRGFGTPGETVAFSFSIKCREDLAQIELSVSSLARDSWQIDPRQIAMYVVGVWDVSGVGIFQSNRMTVSELLLKDDRMPLEDGYIENANQGIGSESPLWRYCPPDVRLTDSVVTSLVAGESKQIWLSVKIASETPPGLYSGCLNITTQQGQEHKLSIELDVLPFTLLEPAQDLLLWYRGSMDQQQGQFYVSPELFRLHLQDIYDHGFRSISIAEKDRATAQLAIDIAEDVGFTRHIVLRSIPFNAEALHFKSLTPVFYLSDEMDAAGCNQISAKIGRAHV